MSWSLDVKCASYPSDIHDLDGRQLPSLNMTTLWGEEEKWQFLKQNENKNAAFVEVQNILSNNDTVSAPKQTVTIKNPFKWNILQQVLEPSTY